MVTAFAVAWPYRGDWARVVANGTMHRPLAQAHSWRYQLDRINLDDLAADASDLLVIDYAKKDGKVPLTPEDVARIKVRPDGRPRLVVADAGVHEDHMALRAEQPRMGAHHEAL
ncbi:MAG: hypothetical protein ABL893_11915, partial [Hyphomicrobium sp.]